MELPWANHLQNKIQSVDLHSKVQVLQYVGNSTYPDHIIMDAAPHPDPVRDEYRRVDGEVDEEVELDPRLGVAVELRREEEDAREEADGGGQVEGAPLRRAPEGLRDEGDVRAEQGHHHAQVVLLQPPADMISSHLSLLVFIDLLDALNALPDCRGIFTS